MQLVTALEVHTTFFNGLTTNAGGTTEFSGNVVRPHQTFNDDIVLNGSMNIGNTTTNAGLSATFNGQVDATNSNIQLGFVITAIDKGELEQSGRSTF